MVFSTMALHYRDFCFCWLSSFNEEDMSWYGLFCENMATATRWLSTSSIFIRRFRCPTAHRSSYLPRDTPSLQVSSPSMTKTRMEPCHQVSLMDFSLSATLHPGGLRPISVKSSTPTRKDGLRYKVFFPSGRESYCLYFIIFSFMTSILCHQLDNIHWLQRNA